MTNRLMTILSRALSVLCHPLFMPTYGMILFCATFSTQHMTLPTAYWLIAVFCTFMFTAVIPLSVIIIQLVRGSITSIEIRQAHERTSVYVYTTVCYTFWCYFVLQVLHAPIVLFTIGIGAILTLVGVTLINRRWKISAHLSGIGGLLGGICAYCYADALLLPMGLIGIILGIALLLMYARLYLEAHTPMQVVAGLLFGIIMTFIPSLVLCLSFL